MPSFILIVSIRRYKRKFSLQNDTKMNQILTFLSDLSKNNNREWFAANKSTYLEVKDKIELLTARLISDLAKFEPEAAHLTPSECLYRIYRDTRFKSDKTPYKTHIGIYISPYGGKKSTRAGYYVHFEPHNCFLGGGMWCPPAPLLKAVRQSIYDNVEEYLEIIDNPEFKGLYGEPGENLLKTAPKGFPKDWDHIGLLRPRDYTAGTRISDRTITSKNAPAKIIDAFRILKPYNDFLNYTFEETPDLPLWYE